MYICLYVYKYINAYINIYILIYTYIYIHITILNFVKLSTLFIKKGRHKRYATLTTLAVV